MFYLQDFLFCILCLNLAILIKNFTLSGKVFNNLTVDGKKTIIVCNSSRNWNVKQVNFCIGNNNVKLVNIVQLHVYHINIQVCNL